MDIYDYEPWSGAVYTYERIAREGKLDELDGVLEEVYPEGIDETELNDLLWFEPETVYEWLDMRTETEIREEIEEAEAHLAEISDEIDDLRSDFEYESDEMTEEEAAELWNAEYVGKLVDLEKEAEDVNGEIEKLKEELSEL
jgi:uncharacterized coiled-coil DUF342 family protein